MRTEVQDGETRVFAGYEITIARTSAELLGSTPIRGDRQEALRVIRAAAQWWLQPGTLYEIRESLPGDFGRVRQVAFYQCAVLPEDEMPMQPGQWSRVDAGGYLLHGRERVVPEDVIEGRRE